MKLSVIIPIYCVENTLDRCIKSIVSQSFNNLEIILVNDGSPDRCPQICETWAQHDNRIKVINKPNGGLSDARNAGLDIATGDFVTFIDSDDYIAENTFNCVLTEYNKGYDIIEYPIYRFFGSPKQSLLKFDEITYLDTNEYWIETEAYNHAYACNKIYKRELFNNIRFPKDKVFEDVYILPSLLAISKRIKTVNKGLYYYCWNPNSITAVPKAKSLDMLLDAYLSFTYPINNEKYYMHVLNIQLDVTDRTNVPPKLNNLKIRHTQELNIKDKIKALILNILGIKRLCKLHRILFTIRRCR